MPRSRRTTLSVPYAGAIIRPAKARSETIKLLQSFGAESVGFVDNASGEVVLAFIHRGRKVQVKASARGWAALHLKRNPWKAGRHGTRQTYEAKALAQGQIAINAALLGWVKAETTMIECGIMSFEAVFCGHMITSDGRPMLERAVELLPPPEPEKVVALPGRVV